MNYQNLEQIMIMIVKVKVELRSSANAETQVFRLPSEQCSVSGSVTRSSTETGYRVSSTGHHRALATANYSTILFAMKSFSYALPAVGDTHTAATTF